MGWALRFFYSIFVASALDTAKRRSFRGSEPNQTKTTETKNDQDFLNKPASFLQTNGTIGGVSSGGAGEIDTASQTTIANGPTDLACGTNLHVVV